MCWTCPPPAWPTHVLSLFIKPSWGVSRVNLPILTVLICCLQISYQFWLSWQLVEFLQYNPPHMIVQRAHNLNFKLNYLRYDFKNGFCYVILGNTLLDRQNQWGGLIKIDITFDPFDILWWNLAVIRRNELPLGL